MANMQAVADEVRGWIMDACYEVTLLLVEPNPKYYEYAVELRVSPKSAVDPFGDLLPRVSELDLRLASLEDAGKIKQCVYGESDRVFEYPRFAVKVLLVLA